jgi:biopolymer transport protein ExbB
MAWLAELVERLQGLLDRGGAVMPYILILSLVLWILILERYWFFLFAYPQELKQLREAWATTREHRSRAARKLRAHLSAQFVAATRRSLPLIRSIIQVLPLLGLLGTVTGMIETFEVITVFGGNNRRGMAAGISEALLCTMAGLVTALSGLYFSVHLEGRARRASAQALSALSIE